MPVESSRGRSVYIDWARGLAVLLMIEWHTADAWTRAADRHSAAFGRALVLGGFAAPLFLWLGQSSLFVYWIHVELVYGYATWPLHGRLPLWGTVLAYAAFSVLMYRAVIFRDRIVGNWRVAVTIPLCPSNCHGLICAVVK